MGDPFTVSLKGTSVKAEAAAAQHRGSILAGHIAGPQAAADVQEAPVTGVKFAEPLASGGEYQRAREVRARARAETQDAEVREEYAHGARRVALALPEGVEPCGPDSHMRKRNRAKAKRNSRPVGFLGRTRGLGAVDFSNLSEMDALMETFTRTGDSYAPLDGEALRYGAATTVAGVASLRSRSERPLPFELDSRWANSPLPPPPGNPRLTINGASRKSPHRVAPMREWAGEGDLQGEEKPRRRRRKRRVCINEEDSSVGPVGGAEPGWDPTGRVSPFVLKNAMSANIFMTKHNAVAPHMVESVASKVAEAVRSVEGELDAEIASLLRTAAQGGSAPPAREEVRELEPEPEPVLQPPNELQPRAADPPAPGQGAAAEAEEAAVATAEAVAAEATPPAVAAAPGQLVSRTTAVPIKPGAHDALIAIARSQGFESRLRQPAFDGLVETSIMVTDDPDPLADPDTLVARSLYMDRESLAASAEAETALLGQAMGEHFVGPAVQQQGVLPWTFRGSAKAAGAADGEPPRASRITTVAVAPGSHSAILEYLASPEVEAMLSSALFTGLVEVSAVLSDDSKLAARWVYTGMDALTASDDAQAALIRGLQQHCTSPPSTTHGLLPWSFSGVSNVAFKAQMRRGQCKFGAVANMASQVATECLASQGYDWVIVDSQHAPMNSRKLAAQFMAIRVAGAKSFIRVAGSADRGGIQQALDLGADGILIPFVNTAQDVRDGISCTKYPGDAAATGAVSTGSRSLYMNLRTHYPTHGGGMPPLLQTVGTNRNVIVAVQIETAHALANLEEILAVPGLDIALIGPGDLNSSMGTLIRDGFGCFASPEFLTAIQSILTGCAKHDVIPGLWAFDAATALQMAGMGFRWIPCGGDLHMIQAGAAADVAALEAAFAEVEGVEWRARERSQDLLGKASMVKPPPPPPSPPEESPGET